MDVTTGLEVLGDARSRHCRSLPAHNILLHCLAPGEHVPSTSRRASQWPGYPANVPEIGSHAETDEDAVERTWRGERGSE